MTDDDAIAMRNLMIFAIVAVVVAVAIIPAESTDAVTYPSELVELQYWDALHATIVYVFPDKPIGSTNIPALPSGCTYWVRMDTGEVVTAQTVFSPGAYLIEPYSWVPEPWGNDSTPSSAGPDNTLPTVAIVLSAVAIITSTAAIVILMRRR